MRLFHAPAVLLAFSATCLLAAAPAQAHDTKDAKRTPQQCKTLPGDDKVGERAACLTCISLADKHHYHPDYPANRRCRPDDGRP